MKILYNINISHSKRKNLFKLYEENYKEFFKIFQNEFQIKTEFENTKEELKLKILKLINLLF